MLLPLMQITHFILDSKQWEAYASLKFMLLVGIILILIGYFILFSVPRDASFERMTIQAIGGIGTSIIGSLFVMVYIYKRSK